MVPKALAHHAGPEVVVTAPPCAQLIQPTFPPRGAAHNARAAPPRDEDGVVCGQLIPQVGAVAQRQNPRRRVSGSDTMEVSTAPRGISL